MADKGVDRFSMSLMAPISYSLNVLVGIFLLRYAGDDLLAPHKDDDRGILWFMLVEGAGFLLFGFAGLIFA